MAVAMRRPGFTLWMAWVVAGALGAAVAYSAVQPGNEFLPNQGAWYWAPAMVLAMPLALLQFLVLRGLVGVSALAAGMWVGLTLLASAASVFATSEWYSVAPQVLTRMFGIDTGSDILFAVGDYMNALVLSLAQGGVLAWMIGRKRVAAWWVLISLLAYAVAIRVTVFAITVSGFELRPVGGGYVLPRIAFAALFAAVTGLGLVAIMRMRSPVTAPQRSAPAV